MTLKPLSLAIASLALALGCGLATAGPFEIAGSSTVQKSIVDPVAAKAREATGIEIKMLGVGTGKGMQMLFDGKVSVAAVSDELADAVAAAKKAGATTVPGNLKMVTVLTDKMVPILHPDNTVKALSKDQLKAIFSGKTTNWKEVGGSDGPIAVVVPAAGSGSRGVLEKQVMGGTAFSSTVKELRTSAAEVAEVGRDKSAIGYVGAGVAESAKGKVQEIKGPEVSRPLGFVTVGDPSPEAKKLLDYLQTADAKKLYVE
jgi:phosphate transport system substrate-binding protein